LESAQNVKRLDGVVLSWSHVKDVPQRMGNGIKQEWVWRVFMKEGSVFACLKASDNKARPLVGAWNGFFHLLTPLLKRRKE